MHETKGVSFTRRGVLWLGASGAAGLMASDALADPAGASGLTSWDHFIRRREELVQLARDGTAAGTDAYLYSLAALAVRVSHVPDAKLFPFTPRAPLVSLAPIHRGVPFFVIEWRMEPGALLGPHNHPGYSVCTLGLEGEALVRHYEPSSDAPPLTSKKPFRVRLTRELVLTQRSVTTLGPERDNIHTFKAGPRGARGIDVTTLHAPADVGFSFLELADSHETGSQVEAHWTGM